MTTPGGFAVVVALAVHNLAYTVVSNSLTVAIRGPTAVPPAVRALALPLPTAVAAVLVFALLVAGAGIGVVAARVLVRDSANLGALPAEVYRRRIGTATLSALVVNILTAIAVVAGLVLLVLPGIFLAVSLVFGVVVVAVEDAGVVEALRRSWRLAAGNRLRIFLAMLFVVVVALFAGLLSVPLTIVAPVVGRLGVQVISAVVGVYSLGVIADVYLQVRDETEHEEEAEVGALTAEELEDGI